MTTTAMTRDLTPDQARASEYLRRAGTRAPVADIRRKVEETVRELDELVAGIPEEVVRTRPRPGRWCVQEVVDHLTPWRSAPTRWVIPRRSAPFWQNCPL